MSLLDNIKVKGNRTKATSIALLLVSVARMFGWLDEVSPEDLTQIQLGLAALIALFMRLAIKD